MKYFVGIVFVFTSFHYITWSLITKNIFGNKPDTYIGDLGRLSYSIDSLHPRENKITLNNVHRVFLDHSQTDVLTIGDSFSRGDAGGENANYQDFIATEYDLDVVNITPSENGYIETVLILNSSGVLDKLKPKSIVLQSVERSAIDRFSKDINWDIQGSEELLLAKSPDKFVPRTPEASFINNNNYKAWLYQFLYKYYDNALISKVYKAQLNNNHFSSRNQRELLYFFEDLESIEKSNIKSINLLNENLNQLQAILNTKGIDLYFLPAADKYNIYSKYINDNKYKESNFFELLRTMKNDYYFIDTKSILQKLIDKGEQDVYYSDDTHWSAKASSEIIKRTSFK